MAKFHRCDVCQKEGAMFFQVRSIEARGWTPKYEFCSPACLLKWAKEKEKDWKHQEEFNRRYP